MQTLQKYRGRQVAALCCALLGIVARDVPVRAADESSAAFAEALQQLQTGDASHAAKSLEALTRREPKNALAWRTLGNAYQQLHDYDRAVAAYRRALALNADSPQTLYSIGTAYAAKQDIEHAFEWLIRARATRRFDMTQLTQNPNLSVLRRDPRFASLLPKPAEFEKPFVEPVKIIREWRGQASNDQF